MTRLHTISFIAALLAIGATQAQADDSQQASSLHADFEVDPIAYVFSGHSLHLGLGYRRVRADLGAFAADTPRFLETSDNFRTSASGFGVKLEFFPFAEQKGLFVGADANLSRTWIRRRGTPLAVRQTGFSTGLVAGVRIPVIAGLYVAPWLSVNYTFGTDDIELDGASYDGSGSFGVLPFVHIGYQFL
jgi:hypothetical protein